jgi:UDP-glucose 4-epimerase
MRKILVTGGAGYIGSHVCVSLLELGYELIIVDHQKQNMDYILHRFPECIFHLVDLRNRKELEQIFASYKIKTVFHFAALKSVEESNKDPLLYYENNIMSTLNLLNVMSQFDVLDLIFSSSATVYGGTTGTFTEDSKLEMPTNPYGKTKFFIEHILHDLYSSNSKWNFGILRYFNPVGYDQSIYSSTVKQYNLFPIIQQVAGKKLDQLLVFGSNHPTRDGTCIRDYIHILDLVDGHIELLKFMQANQGYHVFNLGTEKGYSVLEIIQAVENITQQTLPYQFVDPRKGDSPYSVADCKKAKEILGWQPKYNLEEICKSGLGL